MASDETTEVDGVTYARGATPHSSSLPEVLRERAALTPERTWLTFGNESWTFAEALSRAETVASGLHAVGVRRGDRVALMLPNCTEFISLWFGASLLGAVFVPVNVALKGEGLRYLIAHSAPSAIVVDSALVADFDAVVSDEARPRYAFTQLPGDSARWRSLDELMLSPLSEIEWDLPSPGDPASVLYTSGTTGRPKGVVNCHNAYVTAGYEFAHNCVRTRSDDVFYTSLPLFHVNAQMLTTMGSLMSGRPMALSSRFSGSRFLEEVQAAGATVFNYIGAMLTIISKQPPSSRDVNHRLRLAVGGAAPANLWADFESRFGLRVLEIYGLTETATFCLASPPDDIRVGRIGCATSWSEVRVVDTNGNEAPAGEMGEIIVRSRRPNVLFTEYLANPEATEAALVDGWFHTGDRGWVDDDGYFTFVDRMKDCIRRRGENISSYEVESVVNSHPSVAQCAAVGVPSELGEEDVMIVVVPRSDVRLDPAELLGFCASRMASFMVPRYVKLQAALPRTATERVQKYALRAAGAAGAWDAASQD